MVFPLKGDAHEGPSVPVLLPQDDYKRLCELAAEQDRDPAQHARFIVRSVLRQAEAERLIDDNRREAVPS